MDNTIFGAVPHVRSIAWISLTVAAIVAAAPGLYLMIQLSRGRIYDPVLRRVAQGRPFSRPRRAHLRVIPVAE